MQHWNAHFITHAHEGESDSAGENLAQQWQPGPDYTAENTTASILTLLQAEMVEMRIFLFVLDD